MSKNGKYVKTGMSAAMLSMCVGAAAPAHAEYDHHDDGEWTGFYFGGVFGVAHANARVAPSSDDSRGDAGALAGLEFGYNWQSGDWVWGMEVDSVLPDVNPGPGGGQHDLSVDTISTARMRMGMTSGANLLFASAGVGVLTGHHASSDGSNDDHGYGRVRAVLGMGVEHMVTDAMTIKAEGLVLPGCNKFSKSSEVDKLNTVWVARMGINFLF